jgi:hypothetical protein
MGGEMIVGGEMFTFIPNSFIPSFITLNFTVITPAISIAPQKLISPSP